MNKLILILLIIVILKPEMSGQKAPIKFGDVSIDELQMSSYPADTSASAVILCDYGAFTSDPKDYYGYVTPFKFVRIRRIKILKKDGYIWANSSYPCNSDTDIKGITFNLENGRVVKEYLKNGSIFRDRVTDNRYIMRIAMPNVKVGSVIDLQFSTLLPMIQWKFQEDIPVKYSELTMEDTPFIRFKTTFFGNEPLFLSTPNRWVAKAMPSFRSEPLITSKENYISKLELDILDVGLTTISTTWENISSLLMRNTYFGMPLTVSSYLNSVAKSIKESDLTGEEKLRRAFEAVKSTIKWDERESLLTSSGSLGFAYKMKIGNSADVNLILLQLLKKLDFEVQPVALSTRENGFLLPHSPSIEKLNYVIVRLKLGDKIFLLDATEPSLPYYLIPLRCLNYEGRLIDEIKSERVMLGTTYKSKEYISYSLKISEDNKLEGKLTVTSADYAALNFRNKYRKLNGAEEYLEDFLKDKQGLIIGESKIENIDSIYLPVLEDYSIKITDPMNEPGDEIFILPMYYHQLKENPFKLEARKFPVDYGYNFERTITSTLEIPENFEVSVMPVPVKIKLPDNAATLTYLVNRSGNIVTVKSIFSVNKIMFLPDEYGSLREFYDQVIKKQSEPLILKRRRI